MKSNSLVLGYGGWYDMIPRWSTMAGWRQRGTELWCERAHDLPRSLAPSYHCVLRDTKEHVLWGRSTVIGRQFVAAAKITYGIDVYRYLPPVR